MSVGTTPAFPFPRSGSRLGALLRLGRPRFLLGGALLYGLGTAMAVTRYPFRPRDYLLGQLGVSAIQLMTHYANDYYDVAADRANPTPTRWSGGSRVLANGELAPRVARDAALVLGVAGGAVGAGLLLLRHPTPGTALLMILSLVLSWAYSAPPLNLHARGLGPLTAGLVVGGLTPLVGYGMQGGPWDAGILASVVPTVLAQAAMILFLDFPDAEGDARVGKRTLVVELGDRGAAGVVAVLVLATYASLPLSVAAGMPPSAAVLVAGTAPLGATLVWAVLYGTWRPAGRAGRLTFGAIAWFTSIALGELAVALARIFSRG